MKSGPVRDASRAGTGLPGVLLFVAAVVACWSVLPALLQTVPHADNVEQLNWAHALQWGYLKHPPLPTALLWLAESVAGPSALLTYLLAMLCVGASLLLIWRCALLLGGRGTALVALLLSSADYYLMGRGSFLNHNTVMLPFVAASAWAVLRIVRQPAGRHSWQLWLLLGLVQALGLLTKYQMAIIIIANAAALLAAGPWRRPGGALAFAIHVLLCAAATGLPLLPHYFWLQQHAFSSFAYAGQNLLADLPPLARLGHTLGFAAQQVGRLAPVAIALELALLLQRVRGLPRGTAPAAGGAAIPRPAVPATGDATANAAANAAANATADAAKGATVDAGEGATDAAIDAATDAASRRALLLLAVVPITLVLGLALFGGVAPQNHWGASSTLLLPLLAATRLRRVAALQARTTLPAVIAVHAIAVLWNIAVAVEAPGFHHSFAARPLAAQALAHWQQHEHGPLRVVTGPDWDAGAIALYLPGNPAVLPSGDRRQAPWISDAELDGCGALVLWRPGQPAGEQVGAAIAARIESPVILQEHMARGIVSTIGAGILAPTRSGCGTTAP